MTAAELRQRLRALGWRVAPGLRTTYIPMAKRGDDGKRRRSSTNPAGRTWTEPRGEVRGTARQGHVAAASRAPREDS